jgi:hypothetical protein
MLFAKTVANKTIKNNTTQRHKKPSGVLRNKNAITKNTNHKSAIILSSYGNNSHDDGESKYKNVITFYFIPKSTNTTLPKK